MTKETNETEYAYINTERIHINTYISEDYKNKGYIPRNEHGEELVLVNGVIRKPHFRTKVSSDSDMSEWHKDWQSNFECTEKKFLKINDKQIKDRRADVYIQNLNRVVQIVGEIQHSRIEKREVKERNDDYKLYGIRVVWVIDGNIKNKNGKNRITIKKQKKRIILEFKAGDWLHENFTDCDYVYYDIEGEIYKVNPKLIKKTQIYVHNPIEKCDFITKLKTEENFWESEELTQSFLQLVNSGAGSGKTFTMVQQLLIKDYISCHIFLSKQHSNRKIMNAEFDDQYDKGLLNNINIITRYDEENKKNIVLCNYKDTKKEFYIIFATVDSFNYAVGQKQEDSHNLFEGIVNSIKKGHHKTNNSGGVKFADVDPTLNTEAIIYIDEVQDLPETYAEAFIKILETYNTNMYCVGDILQSLSYPINALTRLQKYESKAVTIYKEEPTNVVRRFSNPVLINNVNSMIQFREYNLPVMTPHTEEKEEYDNNPVTYFPCKPIYQDMDNDNIVLNDSIKVIINLFKNVITKYGAVPEDFLVLSPYVTKNILLSYLNIALDTMWQNTMEDDEYIKNVKSKHLYWKDKLPHKYRRYSIFHKAQEYGSINLSESDHSTRIVSIHSSKGDGRPFVFALCITQATLSLSSSSSTNNLCYNSLLHVAITRQKKLLFFGFEENNDDIHNRIKNTGCTIDTSQSVSFNFKKNIDFKKVKSLETETNQKFFEDIKDKIFSIDPKTPFIKKLESGERKIIDMGDHNIRAHCMHINVYIKLYNHNQATKNTKKNQLYCLLENIVNQEIKVVSTRKKYIERLKEKKITLLKFPNKNKVNDYDSYVKIMKKIMEGIKIKIDENSEFIPYFCPIESVMLAYMLNICKEGIYINIPIDSLYHIIDSYSNSFVESIDGHEQCQCKKIFTKDIGEETNIKKYLYQHYEESLKIDKITDSFLKKYNKVKWLYKHFVNYEGGNEEFSLYKQFEFIGYDGDNVYALNIKPQFNELNCNDFIQKAVLDTYLLQNTADEKFKDKKIMSFVISTDQDNVFEYNCTASVKRSNDFIGSFLNECIIQNYFKNDHKRYSQILENIVKNNKYKIESIVNDISTQIKENEKKIPDYLKIALNTFNRNISSGKIKKLDLENRKKKIDKYLANFKDDIDGYLETSLKKFLYIKDDIDESE